LFYFIIDIITKKFSARSTCLGWNA